jgi:diguanylate cyclase (GGDEF)-like protein/PAS domain S-box-containing protein
VAAPRDAELDDAEAEANFALGGWQKVNPSSHDDLVDSDQKTDAYDDDWRHELAVRWAGQLGRVVSESDSGLRELVNIVIDALDDPSRSDEVGVTVGGRLATMDRGDTLAVTQKVLTEHLADRGESSTHLPALLAAITWGYLVAGQHQHDSDSAPAHELERSPASWERDLGIGADRLWDLFEGIPVGVAICDLGGRLLVVNPALASMLDLNTADLTGTSIYDLFVEEDAHHLAAGCAELIAMAGTLRLRERRRLVCASSGEEIWSTVCMSLMRDSAGEPGYLLSTIQDISELQLLQERFQYQALHDVMTGLPNRQFFRTRLEAVLTSLPPDAELTLYHLALDGFEVINDGLGYQAGDTLVKAVARSIERLIEGEEGMVARFGGTEFGILLRRSAGSPSIAEFATMINEELSEPIYVDDHGIATTASIGVVRRSASEGTPEAMMLAAEAALRRAKSAGHRQWALFDRLRDPQERSIARLAARIPGALEMGELTVVYRPVVRLGDERVVGAGANLRWLPPDRAPLEHDDVVDLAERSGVTLALRDWMLRAVWERATDRHRAGSRGTVQVDLTVNQARDPDLVATVQRVFGELDADEVDWLWISFPMEVLLGDSDEVRENLELLGSSLGLRTAVHDFRGAPEELRLVRKLPVQALRLAPELVDLVREAPDEPEAQSLLQMLPLVRSCDRSVAVDGITTRESASWWHTMGCEVASGPLYGEPGAELPMILSESDAGV